MDIKQAVQTMDPAFFVILFIGICCVALFCWFTWYRKAKRARLIEDVPTSKIRSAAQGYNEIIGHGEFIQNDVIRSPLSGRECIWYKFKVQERRRDSKGNTYWETVESKVSDDIFVLEDETGKCIVDPNGAEVIAYEKDNWSGQKRNPGVLPHSKSSTLFSGHPYKYTEEWIEPGEILYAIGDFETEGTGEDIPDLRDEVREVLRYWKANSDQFLKPFDTNKDGKIDLEEWEQVKQAAEQKVLNDRVDSPNLGIAHIMRKPDAQPYILSSLNIDELVKH